jgi:hypothetical protein
MEERYQGYQAVSEQSEFSNATQSEVIFHQRNSVDELESPEGSSLLRMSTKPLEGKKTDFPSLLTFKIQEVQSEGSVAEEDDRLKSSLLMNSQFEGEKTNLSYYVDSNLLFSDGKMSKSSHHQNPG